MNICIVCTAHEYKARQIKQSL